MNLFDLVTVPVRFAVAVGETAVGVAKLASPRGPSRFIIQLAEATSDDRPAGQAIDRMLEKDGQLDRIMAPGGPIDRILAEGGILDRLLAENGLLDQVLDAGGTLDQLVDALDQMTRMAPLIEAINNPMRGFDESAQRLSGAVDPVRNLAGSIPGLGRLSAASATPEPTADVDPVVKDRKK
jgi:hypothetical protein